MKNYNYEHNTNYGDWICPIKGKKYKETWMDHDRPGGNNSCIHCNPKNYKPIGQKLRELNEARKEQKKSKIKTNLKNLSVEELVETYMAGDKALKKKIRAELRKHGHSIKKIEAKKITATKGDKLTNLERKFYKETDRDKLTENDLFVLLSDLYDLYNTEDHFDVEMYRPKFKLLKGQRRLGYYQFVHQTIGFSERHLRYSSFQDIKDTLLHEMAHQYVSEILKQPFHKHGPIWKGIAHKAGCSFRAKARNQINLQSRIERRCTKINQAGLSSILNGRQRHMVIKNLKKALDRANKKLNES